MTRLPHLVAFGQGGKIGSRKIRRRKTRRRKTRRRKIRRKENSPHGKFAAKKFRNLSIIERNKEKDVNLENINYFLKFCCTGTS